MRAALSLILAASALSVGACTTPAADEPAAAASAAVDPSSPLSAPGYMQMAASSDMFEIESSRMALQMSQNPAVRSFAQMMVNDHSRTTSEIMAAAQSMGMQPPPPQMLPQHADMLNRLRAAAPGDFDRAYKAEQVMAHQEALTLHQNFAQGGDAPALRAVAARAVPIVQGHLTQAQNLPETMAAPMQTQPYPQQEQAPARRRAGERG